MEHRQPHSLSVVSPFQVGIPTARAMNIGICRSATIMTDIFDYGVRSLADLVHRSAISDDGGDNRGDHCETHRAFTNLLSWPVRGIEGQAIARQTVPK